MNSMSSFSSASVQSLHRPMGGMAFLPFLELSTSASMPAAIRGSQAALSPVLGAPAAPVPWQAMQYMLYLAGGSAWAVAAAKPMARAADAINRRFMVDPSSRYPSRKNSSG